MSLPIKMSVAAYLLFTYPPLSAADKKGGDGKGLPQLKADCEPELSSLRAASEKEPAAARDWILPNQLPNVPFQFSAANGPQTSLFLRGADVTKREDQVSGQSNIDTQRRPGVTMAVVGENSGGGLYFKSGDGKAIDLRHDSPLKAMTSREMTGIKGSFTSSADSLDVRGISIGDLRVVREFKKDSSIPAGTENAKLTIQDNGKTLVFTRTALDGTKYRMTLKSENGTVFEIKGGQLSRILAGSGNKPIRVTMSLWTSAKLPRPIALHKIFKPGFKVPSRLIEAVHALAFLTYHDFLLAGGWRFLTYFGRDTLLSVKMLFPYLNPEVVEAGLGSVLEFMGTEGKPAHELAYGDFSVLEKQKHGEAVTAENLHQPFADRKMKDDVFMVLPLFADFARSYPERVEAFLNRRRTDGMTYAEMLRRNIQSVLQQARPFALDPQLKNLIAFVGEGDWRDGSGMNGDVARTGVYAFSINASLVSGALGAIARSAEHPAIRQHLLKGLNLASVRSMEQVWDTQARQFFDVQVPVDEARRQTALFSRSLNLDPTPALQALDDFQRRSPGQNLSFPALSILQQEARALKVVNSDESFRLLFNDPSPAELLEIIRRLRTPFPAGINLPFGVLVANPIFEDDFYRELYSREAYQGLVIWPHVNGMYLAGFDRQLQRTDLSAGLRATLTQAREELRRMSSHPDVPPVVELLTFGVNRGKPVPVPWIGRGDVNTVQLWAAAMAMLVHGQRESPRAP